MDRSVLSSVALARALELRDLSDLAGGPHALQLIVDSLVRALSKTYPHARSIVHRGPRVVDIADNYDCLGYEAGAVARDARYTRYVDDRSMLRSHTSAMIPPLLRAIAADGNEEDCVLVCPGVVYRRDAIDRTHCGEPHQVDVWRIRRDGPNEPLGSADLDALIGTAVGAVLRSSGLRTHSAVHPYTKNGLQIDVGVGAAAWIEIGECGLAHPDVLERAGLDPRCWSGLAMGLGLDRLLMLDKGVDDIRLLRATDPRIARQMLDRSPYRGVSDLPAIRRDLSVVVDADDSVEELGDRVRSALGPDADVVEEVGVEAETSYEALPERARVRLGLTTTQKNVLVRVVLRHVSRTLTHEEANALRDRIYEAIHRGPIAEWAAR